MTTKADATTIYFEKDRDTKHTTRYQEVTKDDALPQIIGTLYVQKWFAHGTDRIRVTIAREAE